MTENRAGVSISAIQMEVETDLIQNNLEKILNRIENSSADLLVFPESCTGGFQYDCLEEIALFNRGALESVQTLALETGRSIILPLLYGENGNIYNRQFCIDRAGEIVATYDKMHLIGVLREDRYLAPGAEPGFVLFPLEGYDLRIGLVTCYDLRFPELFRYINVKYNVDLFILPAMWPVERQEHFRILSRARAVENLAPVITCNAVGRCGNMNLCGFSSITDEKGEILYEASSDGEDTVYYNFNRSAMEKWRERFPALSDIRPELLGLKGAG